jgi:hypothetical protein
VNRILQSLKFWCPCIVAKRIHRLKFPEPRSIVTAFVLIIVVVFAGITSLAPVHASSPTISNATVLNQKTSLTLPSGGQIYIYAFATDGSARTNSFVNSLGYLVPPTSVRNMDGNPVAGVAITTSDTNSYTTSTSSYTIAGASVSGFGAQQGGLVTPVAYPAINGAPGANGVSVLTAACCTKGKPWPGALVVVVAIAGDEQCISSISGLPGLVIDASNSNSGNPTIIIGHVYDVSGAGPGVVTMVSSQCAAGQNPNNAADLLDVFIFVPVSG